MSRQNVETFLKGAEAVNRGDWPGLIVYMDPQIVFVPQRAPVQGEYVGHDAVRAFARDTNDTFELFQIEYEDVRDLGERVLALGTLRIRGRGSGIETQVPSTVLASFRDGLIARLQDFGDRRRALAAAGLRE